MPLLLNIASDQDAQILKAPLEAPPLEAPPLDGPPVEVSCFSAPLPLEMDTSKCSQSLHVANNDSIMFEVNPGFEIPPFDIDLFNAMLEQEPVSEPTSEEVAAPSFLKAVLGK